VAPYPGQHAGYPYQQRPRRQPSGVGLPRPVAVEPVAGTPFGVAVVEVASTTSGPATASLVAGVASILISLVVGCFGTLGASDGWGPTVAGAFAVLAAFLGVAGLVLGRAGLRQIRRTSGWGAVTGRGLAISGVVCATIGLLVTVIAMGASFALLSG
jgi:hypothetical protein